MFTSFVFGNTRQFAAFRWKTSRHAADRHAVRQRDATLAQDTGADMIADRASCCAAEDEFLNAAPPAVARAADEICRS